MRQPARTFLAAALLVATSLASARARAADPTTADCLAASEKSLSLRSGHKLRDARAQALTCAAVSCPADVREECLRRVSDLNAAMPTIVFETKDQSGNDLGGVKVTMDGQVLAERLEGTALSIDPGQHSFTFEAAGQPTVQKQFVIRESEKGRRERVVFVATNGVAEPSRVGSVPPPSDSAPVLVVKPSSSSSSEGFFATLGTRRTVALAAAAVGVVGLGVGVAFGLSSMSKHDEAQKACPGACADQKGVDLWKDAQSAGNVSTVGFVVGAVGLAGAAVLWLTGKPEPAVAQHETTPTVVGLGLGSVVVKGAW
jgi:hypothetical protein